LGVVICRSGCHLCAVALLAGLFQRVVLGFSLLNLSAGFGMAGYITSSCHQLVTFDWRRRFCCFRQFGQTVVCQKIKPTCGSVLKPARRHVELFSAFSWSGQDNGG